MIGPILRRAGAPAVPAAAALVVGTLLGAEAVSGAVPAALLAVASAGLGLTARERSPALARSALVLAFGGTGFLSGSLRIASPAREAERAWWSAPPEPGRGEKLEGVLADFWSGAPPRARGRLRAEWIGTGGARRPFPADVVLFVSGLEALRGIERGDRVVVTGRVRAEDAPASDREIALPWRRFRASVKSALLVERRGGTLLSLLQSPNRWLASRVPRGGARFERDVRGPLEALLLGRTSELDRGMVADYRRGGLYHLLVISGLHVALAAGLAWWALRLAGVRGKLRDAALLVAVAGIVLVGGANSPAVRAGLVFAVFLSARLLERPIGGAQALGLSALALFLVEPEALYSVGTVLTFAAVGGIALFTAPIRARLPARPEWLFSGLATSLAAQAATAPILLWRFNLLAAGAWLTTPLAIPLSTFAIALGAILLAFFAAGLSPGPLVPLFAASTRLLAWLAERAAFLAFLRPTPPLSEVLLVLALLFAAALLPRPRLRSLAAGAALVGFLRLSLERGPNGPDRGLSMEALDVGQGDAILLRWRRHALLVDGGGPFDLDARDFGRTRLLPKLLDRGVTRLDAVVVTHPHPDHALGVFAVLSELSVGALWLSTGVDEGRLYADLAAAAASRGIPVARLRMGERREIAGATLAVLHSGGRRRKVDPVNNQSVVGVLARDGRRVLLTGDVGAATEIALADAGLLSAVDVLKVGHHGSRGSTTAALLERARPRAALLSCGVENRFGHPAPETLRALADHGVRVFRTDVSSDVRLELPAGGGTRIWRRGR